MKNSPNYVALEFNFAYLRESHSFLRDYCNRIKGDFHSYCQIMFKEKGSDGMLLIQQVSEKINSCDYVRCPSCKSGRLCDKTLGVQIRAVPITDSSLNVPSSLNTTPFICQAVHVNPVAAFSSAFH